MVTRGIRGATTAAANTRQAILDATAELLCALTEANQIKVEDIVSVWFTTTHDLDAAFPASAARSIGWDNVALLDAQAPRIADDMARCIRVLIHWNTDRAADEVQHVYLHAARQLRPDRTQEKAQ